MEPFQGKVCYFQNFLYVFAFRRHFVSVMLWIPLPPRVPARVSVDVKSILHSIDEPQRPSDIGSEPKRNLTQFSINMSC